MVGEYRIRTVPCLLVDEDAFIDELRGLDADGCERHVRGVIGVSGRRECSVRGADLSP